MTPKHQSESTRLYRKTITSKLVNIVKKYQTEHEKTLSQDEIKAITTFLEGLDIENKAFDSEISLKSMSPRLRYVNPNNTSMEMMLALKLLQRPLNKTVHKVFNSQPKMTNKEMEMIEEYSSSWQGGLSFTIRL